MTGGRIHDYGNDTHGPVDCRLPIDTSSDAAALSRGNKDKVFHLKIPDQLGDSRASMP
jgi:hypothetical protein